MLQLVCLHEMLCVAVLFACNFILLVSFLLVTASSRKAKALAEDAFFHPSIMSISYSSIEHYFAIYMVSDLVECLT